MLVIVLLGPIVSACVCLFIGRYLGTLAIRLVLLGYLCSGILAVSLAVTIDDKLIMPILPMSSLLGTSLEVGVSRLDAILLAVIVVVSGCVISYAVYYMAEDPHYIRFIGLLSTFAFFMTILTVSTNLITLFVS